MRIVGGQLGGRKFNPPAGLPARPTTDLAREGLFNILHNILDFEGMHALELFAGTGSVSYELASRGAAAITVVEQDNPSVAFIKKTAADFHILPQLSVIKGDVFRYLKTETKQFDFIFADPPYALPGMKELPQLILDRSLLKEEGLFVLEHDIKNGFEDHPHFMRSKKYGDTIFTFFTQFPKAQ